MTATDVPAADTPESVRDLVASLPIEDRVRLLTGATTFTLHPLPAIGLRALALSDGPIGVRGTGDDAPSAELPAPSAMAATWDESLLAELGALMASEARRKHVDIVLAPVVNLHRTPVGGRHFECLAEDPVLTARMAVPFVRAIQAAGIGACVKHFVANESETERTRYLARVSPRALRELYLAPFERVVRDAEVWAVMAAYNGLDDGEEAAPASEHHRLLRSILKEEWGFDGLVVSDWQATKSTVASALAGLDLVMPGPGGPWEEHLLAAVRAGTVPESVIDDKVARVLAVAQRAGALSGEAGTLPAYRRDEDAPAPDSAPVRALLRRAVARSTVLLRNQVPGEPGTPLLPLAAHGVRRVALIGDNALEPFTQGGGSASVRPPHTSTPLAALRDALPAATVTAHPAGSTRRHPPYAGTEALPGGFTVELLDDTGTVLRREHHDAPWDGWLRGLPPEARGVRIGAELRLSGAGEHHVELGPVGRHWISMDGETVSESGIAVGSEVILDSSASHPETVLRVVRVGDGGARSVRVEALVQVVPAAGFGRFARLELRHRPPGPGPAEQLADAVAAAGAADVAVVVVGTNPEVESEGWDRTDLALPGDQDELVRRVAAANPRTVVVVNAGAPVLLPWLDHVPAVLWWWLPGQEGGAALADVLLGVSEPGGRLPWTLPARAEDVPVPDAIPVAGVVDYAEDLDAGHRGWDRLGRTPAREFGFGLGYGRWDYRAVEVTGWSPERGVTARLTVRNDAERPAREVAQLYLAVDDAAVDAPRRPVRWLGAFATIDAAPGQTVEVEIAVPPRAFQIWDDAAAAWRTPAGRYGVHVGRSSRDLRLRASVDIAAEAV